MAPTTTLQQRQQELQALLATPEGQQEIQQLEAQYQKSSGRHRPPRTSVITYILVYERGIGLIAN